MKKHVRFIILIGIIARLLVACNNNKPAIEKAFYYWKNNENSLRDGELLKLKELNIQKLYVKFFEVVPDEIFDAVPSAKLQLQISKYYDYRIERDSALNRVITGMAIIPVIFIKNDVLLKLSKDNIDTLAVNINFLVEKYYHKKFNKYEFNEIQIDCDWTAKTKDNYFYLLNALKKVCTKNISCTLRLYPYTYPDIMGIPPVDKVTLMCYNLINPLGNSNSIQNNKELKSYLRKAKQYPLHLDIALPVFSWIQLYHNNQLVEIINGSVEDYRNALKQINSLWFEVHDDIQIGEYFLRPGDKIKYENVTNESTLESISILRKYIKFDEQISVTFFHLDEKNLNKYKNEELRSFFDAFNK